METLKEVKDYSYYINRERKGLYPNMKQAPTNARLKRVFPRGIYSEWCDMERSMLPSFRQTFTRLERIIIFTKLIVGWGQPRMKKKLGITRRQAGKTYRRLEEYGYQAIPLPKTRKRGKDE